MAAKILIIEDNQDNLDLMTYLINHAGYDTIAAQDGETGVDLAIKEVPNLIVCDIQLPKKDGYAIVKQLKSMEPPYDQIPIIAITAYAMVGDRERIIAAGFDDYISKPIEPSIFVSQIERHLDEKLRLPRKKTESQSAEQADIQSISKKPRSRGTILIVENTPENHLLYQSLLKSINFSIIAANNCTQALTLLKSGIKPDLILSDLHLPDRDGLSLMQELKMDKTLAKLPFILISSSKPNHKELELAKKIEIEQLILRPIEPKAFLEIIEKVWQKHYNHKNNNNADITKQEE